MNEIVHNIKNKKINEKNTKIHIILYYYYYFQFQKKMSEGILYWYFK